MSEVETKISEEPMEEPDSTIAAAAKAQRAVDLTAASSKKELPTGTYTTDYNILMYHSIVLSIMRSSATRDAVQTQLRILRDRLKRRDNSAVEIRSLQAEVNACVKELTKMETQEQEYMTLARPILEKYVEMKNKRRPRLFGEEETEEIMDNDCYERIEIIEAYFSVAQRFVEVNVVREVKLDHVCPVCGSEFIQQDDMTLCSNEDCRYETTSTVQCVNYSELDRGSASNRKDDSEEEFIKLMDKIQGRQKLDVKNLYEDLDNYFTSNHKLPTGEAVRQRPMDGPRRRRGTYRSMMNEALKATGHTEMYEHTNLICHNYWGWTLPDFSHLTEAIKQDRAVLCALYREYKQTPEFKMKYKRKSDLNGQLVLRNLLEKHGFETFDDDFRELKTDNTIKSHREILSYLFKRAGWKCKVII